MNPVVIKIGGSIFDLSDTTPVDLVLLQNRGYKIVVVHGGGKMINEWLNITNTQAKFVGGLRVTDEHTLKVATGVLCGIVNKEIVSQILKSGGKAIGISGVDGNLVQATVLNQELGYVGEALTIDPTILELLLDEGYIPVIAPICLNSNKKVNDSINLLNVNGDLVAAEIASSIMADKLIFLTNVEGLYNHDKRLISKININNARQLIESGVITGGMAVKIKACINALANVKLTRIIDGRISHALLKEFENGSGGTTIAQ